MTLTYEHVVTRARADARELVSVRRDGARAIVTLDDPERLNPLSAELTVQLHAALGELARDPELRTVVLTGRDPAFSAGGDLPVDARHRTGDAGREPAGATDIWRWIRNEFGAIARLITRARPARAADGDGRGLVRADRADAASRD